MSKPRHKADPEEDRADISGAELAAIVAGATKNKVSTGGEDADEIAKAINNHAYLLVSERKRRARRAKVQEAAEIVLSHIKEVGYPMDERLGTLHVALENALPALFGSMPDYNLEPYQGPAFVIHQLSCMLCEEAGFKPAYSRTSYAARITAAILQRLGYVVTPAALEAFIGSWDRPSAAT